jgi:DNA-directed RNA polymerase specialized sigma24 family protein
MSLVQRRGKAAHAESNSALLEALFEQHWERLCGVAYRMIGNGAEVEDLALEAFVQL